MQMYYMYYIINFIYIDKMLSNLSVRKRLHIFICFRMEGVFSLEIKHNLPENYYHIIINTIIWPVLSGS